MLVFLLSLLLNACSTLPDIEDVSRIPSKALSDPSGTRLYEDLKGLLALHPGQSGFYTLPSGEDAFIARMRLIHSADKTLDLQYYIWHEDLTGGAMLGAILAAA